MYDVLIRYGGNTAKHDDDYALLDKLLDCTRVFMNRVPQRGEGVNLFIERCFEPMRMACEDYKRKKKK